MQVSINGTSKEVVQFLLSLSGQIAGVMTGPAPVVTEVVRTPAATCLRVGQVAHMHPDQIRGALSGADGVVLLKTPPEPTADPEKGIAGSGVTFDGAQSVESLTPQELGDKLSPEPTAKAEEPKTRKRREKASGESKLGTGAVSAVEPTAAQTPEASPVAPKPVAGVTLPDEWPLMSAEARRNWAQAATGITAMQRHQLFEANPIAESTQTKPEPEVAAKPATTPGSDTPAVECVLPPTWTAWSTAKRIMWATMRSVDETNSLLKQFGFAGQIPDATADTLFQVRRKLEIAMRMEAQA